MFKILESSCHLNKNNQDFNQNSLASMSLLPTTIIFTAFDANLSLDFCVMFLQFLKTFDRLSLYSLLYKIKNNFDIKK